MILIVCVDDKGGMAFNKRRQTRDRVQRERLWELVGEGRLFIAPYTARLLFQETVKETVYASEDYLDRAGEGDYAWAEREMPAEALTGAEKLILFRWGRSYPADVFFPMERLSEYELISRESFAGSSHDEILQEVYVPCGRSR